MSWFFIALISPALWSIVYHLDKYILSEYFKNKGPGALLIYSSLIGIVLLPIIYFFEPAVLDINLSLALLTILNGFLYVISVIPYLYALEQEETSIVAPLFQMVPIFSFALGSIFLGEQLTTWQLLGSAIVILGAIIINVEMAEDTATKLSLKADVFGLMALGSFLVAANSLLFKYVAIEENFWVTSFWEYIGFSIFGICMLIFVKKYRTEFFNSFRHNSKKLMSLNILNEFINIGAKVGVNVASLLAPLTLVWVAGGFEPVFVFAYGVFLTIFFPKMANEDLSRQSLIQKSASIVLIVIGSVVLSF